MPATCRWTWGQPDPSGQTGKPSSLQIQELSSPCVQEDINIEAILEEYHTAHSSHDWKPIMKRFLHYFLGFVLVLCTWQKPCHQGGEDGRLPLTDTSQKRVEQTIASHSKDNAWKWKHGAEETKPQTKEAEEEEANIKNCEGLYHLQSRLLIHTTKGPPPVSRWKSGPHLPKPLMLL